MSDDWWNQPDEFVTESLSKVLDRAVGLLDRTDGEIKGDDKIQWKYITSSLIKGCGGANIYGCEWVHRGWNLALINDELKYCRFDLRNYGKVSLLSIEESVTDTKKVESTDG
jgi:hypothetical protein